MLHCKERKYLLDYIIEETNDLLSSDFYTLTTRTYFCINDLHKFPICPSCGRIIDNKNVANIKLGYNQYCSRSCINKDPNIRRKIDSTNFKKFGVVNALCLESSREKNRQVKAANKKPKQNYIRKSKEEVSLNHKKGYYEKYIKTMNEKYGVNNISQLQEIKEKKKKTLLKNYGTTHFGYNFSKNYFKKHGIHNPSQSAEIHRKQVSKYTFEDKKFSSAAEIAFYIWLRDNQIDFEYEPNVFFTFEFNGIKRRYFPDFKVNNQIIEIKGDHFFDKNGKMKCPFKRKEWSDKTKENIDALYEAKHQCMIENNVKIILYSEMNFYFEYINKMYGKNYLKQFKNFK